MTGCENQSDKAGHPRRATLTPARESVGIRRSRRRLTGSTVDSISGLSSGGAGRRPQPGRHNPGARSGRLTFIEKGQDSYPRRNPDRALRENSVAHFEPAVLLSASARAPKRRTCTTFLSQSACFINGIDPVYIPGSVIDLVTSVIAETTAPSQISR